MPELGYKCSVDGVITWITNLEKGLIEGERYFLDQLMQGFQFVGRRLGIGNLQGIRIAEEQAPKLL